MSADLEQPIHQATAAEVGDDYDTASPATRAAGSPDFDIVSGDTPVNCSARCCTARCKAAAAIAVVVTAAVTLLVLVVYDGISSANGGAALFTAPTSAGGVALIGGACTGSFTMTVYTGAGCTVPRTECGPDDVNLPADGSACASGDVTNASQTVEWISGECVRCPSSCPGAFGDADFLQALAASDPAVAPAYMKVTWAASVATVEYFSDASCTAPDKISAENIHAATAHLLRARVVAEFDELMIPGLNDCITASATGFAGDVASAEPVCGGSGVTIDRVRHCHALAGYVAAAYTSCTSHPYAERII